MRIPMDIQPGHLGEAGEIAWTLPMDLPIGKQTLRFGSNSWDFWVYPNETRCPLPEGVTLTAEPEEMKRAVAAGGTVLYTGPSFRSGKGNFKPVYWSARWFPVKNPACAALGAWFDVAHPALAGFPTEEFTDWQWYTLAQGCVIHELEGMPDAYRPIGLSVNDFHFSLFTATLFEVLVGKGRLLVCGYDLESDTPESRRLRASLMAYLAGPPAVGTVRMDEGWLSREFDVAPKCEDFSDAVYDVSTNWTGRAFETELRGFAPVTGFVRVDFHQAGGDLTSGRGLIEGRVFEVPFTTQKGQRTSVSLPIVREDMLDGRIELKVNVMTGDALAVDRIRVIGKD